MKVLRLETATLLLSKASAYYLLIMKYLAALFWSNAQCGGRVKVYV